MRTSGQALAIVIGSLNYRQDTDWLLIKLLEKYDLNIVSYCCDDSISSYNNLMKDINWLSVYEKAHRIAIMVITEDDPRELEKIIKLRNNGFQNIPMIFFHSDSSYLYKNNLGKCIYTPDNLMDFLDQYKDSYTGVRSWLGDIDKQSYLRDLATLESTYKELDDEENSGYLAATDYNHRLISQALRIKQWPGEVIKVNLAPPKQKEIVELNRGMTEYLRAVEKLGGLSQEEKDDLLSQTFKPSGKHSFGSNVNGFAIEVFTGEYYITHGHGEHHLAQTRLIDRLTDYYLFSGKKLNENFRIVTGLIFNVKESDFPVLIISANQGVIDARIRTAVSIVAKKKKFIVINSECMVIKD